MAWNVQLISPFHFQNTTGRKVFVGMISKQATDADIREMFSRFGEVDELSILKDTVGNSKGKYKGLNLIRLSLIRNKY